MVFVSETTIEFLQLRASSGDYLDRLELAGDISVDPELLIGFAEDDEYEVRQAAAGNTSMPSEEVEKLLDDEEDSVRQTAASNPVLSAETLTKQSEAQDVHTRLGVAENLSTPSQIIGKLCADEDFDVCAAAQSNPNAPSKALESGDDEARAGNSNTPKKILRQICWDNRRCDGDEEIRIFLALLSNPNTPNSSSEYVEKCLIRQGVHPDDISEALKQQRSRIATSLSNTPISH